MSTITFVPTQRGGTALIFDGYRYNKVRCNNDKNVTYWRCSKNRNCPGRAVTVDNRVKKTNNKHNHPPEAPMPHHGHHNPFLNMAAAAAAAAAHQHAAVQLRAAAAAAAAAAHHQHPQNHNQNHHHNQLVSSLINAANMSPHQAAAFAAAAAQASNYPLLQHHHQQNNHHPQHANLNGLSHLTPQQQHQLVAAHHNQQALQNNHHQQQLLAAAAVAAASDGHNHHIQLGNGKSLGSAIPSSSAANSPGIAPGNDLQASLNSARQFAAVALANQQRLSNSGTPSPSLSPSGCGTIISTDNNDNNKCDGASSRTDSSNGAQNGAAYDMADPATSTSVHHQRHNQHRAMDLNDSDNDQRVHRGENLNSATMMTSNDNKSIVNNITTGSSGLINLSNNNSLGSNNVSSLPATFSESVQAQIALLSLLGLTNPLQWNPSLNIEH